MADFKLTFIHHENYLQAILEGDDGFKDTLVSFKRMADEMVLKDYDKILIEEHLSGTLSEADQKASILEIIDYLKARDIKIKVAHYDSYKDQLLKNKFGENVANNRGLIVKAFDDLIEAKQWLLEN